MAGKLNRLTDAGIKALRASGCTHDGNGLYFQVTEKGNRSWVCRYKLHGRERYMGLGGYPDVSLKAARIALAEARKLIDDGIDPIDARGAKRQVAASALSVEHACESYITAQRAKWKTAKHVDQIRQRLRDFVFPIVGHLPIAEIRNAEALQVLSPIWTTKNPSASRVRQYMEDVTNWSVYAGARTDESNPWEVKKLRFALPLGIHEVKHYPSLPFEQAPAFLVELRAQEGVKARALELVMLTATRIADICGGGKAHSEPMKWSHVDLDAALWRIPDTKTNKPHIVPLSDPGMRLLGEMQRFKDRASDFVFPGAVTGSVLNAATLRHMLKAMGHGGAITVHGMRSCFRTWASECTDYPKDVVEMALAHAQSELDAAYMRGALLDKRRRLMVAWGSYLEGGAVQASGTVVAFRS